MSLSDKLDQLEKAVNDYADREIVRLQAEQKFIEAIQKSNSSNQSDTKTTLQVLADLGQYLEME